MSQPLSTPRPPAAATAAASAERADTERWPARLALMLAHCAGMLDLVALPVWVGTLVSAYHLDPQQAGGLATLFLVGAVFSSLAVAPRWPLPVCRRPPTTPPWPCCTPWPASPRPPPSAAPTAP